MKNANDLLPESNESVADWVLVRRSEEEVEQLMKDIGERNRRWRDAIREGNDSEEV